MATDVTPLTDRAPIVVALDATRRCGETLEMAAALATATGAHLDVIFVQDANLLRIADLPVTREIDRISGMAREIDGSRIRRALECEARQLRIALARIGRTSAVRSTMRVVHGRVLGEALAASTSVEVTFVHGTRRDLPGLWAGRAGPPGTPGARRRRRHVMALFKGGPESERALRVAATLAQMVGGGLTVLVPSRGDEGAEGYKREARGIVSEKEIRFVEGAEGRTLMLGRMLAPGTGSLLVLAKRSDELGDEATRTYLEEIAIPLVLVG